MLRNENIICISSIDWDFIWQGHQEIMASFAKNGNRVLFIENTGIRMPNFKDLSRIKKRISNWLKGTRGFRKEMDNLYIYSPVIFPFPYSKIARWVNRRMLIRPIRNWIKIMEFYEPIIWTFLPTGTALDIINNIERKLLIYYCIADFGVLTGNSKKVNKTEEELIKESDLVFVQGEIFQKKCQRLNKNTYIFPFGVNIEVFENFKVGYNVDRIPPDIKNKKRPIIGYVGGVHKHIDFDLLKFIAESHPEWSIVLIGPVQTITDKISNLPNIFLLGKKGFSELLYYINEFDVCIIPYSKTEYTATVYPTKLNEYHALGKPVISTDLPEIINFNKKNGEGLVSVAKTNDEFISCISEALNNKNEELIRKRLFSARKNSWADRIEKMSGIIEGAINTKLQLSFDWRLRFLGLYKCWPRI